MTLEQRTRRSLTLGVGAGTLRACPGPRIKYGAGFDPGTGSAQQRWLQGGVMTKAKTIQRSPLVVTAH